MAPMNTGTGSNTRNRSETVKMPFRQAPTKGTAANSIGTSTPMRMNVPAYKEVTG